MSEANPELSFNDDAKKWCHFHYWLLRGATTDLALEGRDGKKVSLEAWFVSCEEIPHIVSHPSKKEMVSEIVLEMI